VGLRREGRVEIESRQGVESVRVLFATDFDACFQVMRTGLMGDLRVPGLGTQALIPEVPIFAAAECDAVADIDLRRVDWKAGLVSQVGLKPIVVGAKRRINRRG